MTIELKAPIKTRHCAHQKSTTVLIFHGEEHSHLKWGEMEIEKEASSFDGWKGSHEREEHQFISSKKQHMPHNYSADRSNLEKPTQFGWRRLT